MQTWARRGLNAALITGGLLMLGTGIASADENVNPDRPASPLDPQVKIPVRVHDNAIGTPLGQTNVPGVRRDVVISADTVTNGLPVARAAPVVGQAQGVIGKAAPVAGAVPVVDRTPVNDVFRGNRVTPHLVVPIEFAGNAIAAGGDAHVNASSSEYDTSFSPVWTEGSGGVLAGNVVNLDWALPIRVSGNAIAALGKASTYFVSDNTTVSGGDIVSNGAHGFLAGNVLSGQFATPVGVTGNALNALGIAKAGTEMADQAHAPGTIKTNGDHGVLSGTGAGVPVALPAGVHGNGVGAGGKSYVYERNAVLATAGKPLGLDRGATGDYITTSGKESVLSGTVAGPAVATTATATCDAVALLGTADCVGDTHTFTKAGGSTLTNGDRSFAGGSVLTPSAAVPVQAYANSIAGGGLSNVHHKNEDLAKAGGDSVTSGTEAVLAGTTANPAVAGPVEVFGNATSVLGTSATSSLNDVATKAGGHAASNADRSVASGSVVSGAVALPAEAFGNAAAVGGTTAALVGERKTSTAGGDSVVHGDNSVLGASAVRPSVAGPAQLLSNSATVLGTGTTGVYNDVTTTSGGYTGTTGNDSVAGGNILTPTLGLPTEAFSNNANLAGLTSSKVVEKKVTTVGGPTNAHDDAGVLASNAVVADVVGPLQVFGNSATAAGISRASVIQKTTATGGGWVTAKGTGGAGSGNVAAVPVALPTQAFGLAGGALGQASSWADGDTSSTAGGPVVTDGKVGTASGNVASVPLAGAAQAFGDAVGIASNVNAAGGNTTDSTAGGKVLTSGEDGSISGNVASLQALSIAQAFGNAAALAGLVNGNGDNDIVATSGGDIMTNGDRGSLSGNLADVPVAALAQVFGNAAAVGGTAVGVAPNQTTAITGGNDTTSGRGGNLSGNLATVPVAAAAQAFGNAASVVGNAFAVAPSQTKVLSGGDAATNGEWGSISGNLFAVPVAGVAQVFGNAASAGGHAVGIADNNSKVLSGGEYATVGDFDTLSGIREVAPAGAVVQVFDIPIPIVAHALAQGTNHSLVKADESAPIIDLPVSAGSLAANELPRLPRQAGQHRSGLPVGNAAGVGDLNGIAVPSGNALQGADFTQVLPVANVARLLPPLQAQPPVGRSRADLPNANLDGAGLPHVQDVMSGSALSSVDTAQTLPVMNPVRLLPAQHSLGGPADRA
ncbi:MAG: chaplin family protein [Kibdelosporangium sp.]